MSTARSALDVVRARCTLDLDEFNLSAAERYRFEDMTSNQALLLAAAKAQPDVVSSVVASAPSLDISILDRLAIALTLPILPHLEGRVHFQLSPTLKTASEMIAHGRRIVDLAAQEGIPPQLISLKIPITPEGMLAAREFEVAVLGTMCFSVAQGVAAAQAGCTYVAPYYNELAVHFEGGWKEQGEAHPMAGVVGEIVETYRRGSVRTRVMAASVVSGKEALLLSAIGVNDLTIPVKIVDELAGMTVQGEEEKWRGSGEVREWPDLLARNGERLSAALKEDESVSRRLDYAIKTFARCEADLMTLVKAEWEAQGK